MRQMLIVRLCLQWRQLSTAVDVVLAVCGGAGIGAEVRESSRAERSRTRTSLAHICEETHQRKPFFGERRMMVLHMSASTVHVHRLNILNKSVSLHVSRVCALTTFVTHLEFFFCPGGEVIA